MKSSRTAACVVAGWVCLPEELPRATAAALGIDPPVALRISSVDPHGPAAKGGMRVDDLVTHFNGQQIVNAQEALNRVAAMSPGSDARNSRPSRARAIY